MPLHDIAVSTGALILVIALLFACRPLLLRFTRGHARPGGAVIRAEATLALDRNRRLTLVEIDGRRALLLCGGAADVLLPWPPTVPDARFSACLADVGQGAPS